MDWKHLRTVLAYQMRLTLQDLYALPRVAQGRADLKRWCQWARTAAAKQGQVIDSIMAKVASRLLRPERHALVTLPLLLATAVAAEDWPQFRGPNRDGVRTESGIVDSFPVGAVIADEDLW